MKITRLTMWRVPLSSQTKYSLSKGTTFDVLDSMVLRVDTDQGVPGWGEVCPLPHYLPAYAAGVAPAIIELAPVLLGSNPLGPEALMARCDRFLPGHEYAKSALDIALWDIVAKYAKLPLYSLLGGPFNATVPLYRAIGAANPDEMAAAAAEALEMGYRRFQCSVGGESDPHLDTERLIEVRKAVGSGPAIFGDWNGAATVVDAIRVGKAVEGYDIMLEQPCASIEECAAVKAATGLPLKLDEAVTDVASIVTAVRLGAADAVSIKTSKFGGLSSARKARDLAAHFGITMVIEDTWGSDIATAAALHLGLATPAKYLHAAWNPADYVSPRLDKTTPGPADGRIGVDAGFGLAVTPDLAVLGEPFLVVE